MSTGRLETFRALRVVIDEQSFTRAANRLGLSQPALSHAIRTLEQKLGHRLLERNSRSVAPTAEGARLMQRLGPALDEIDAALGSLGTGGDTPAGTLRLTMGHDAAETLVLPMLGAFLDAHPRIEIEVDTSDALIDIVSGRFEGGIRLRQTVALDMIARPIGGEVWPIVVAAPAYFNRHAPPERPTDLKDHACLRYRMHSGAGIAPWRFRDGGRAFDEKAVSGPIFNDGPLIRSAAVAGLGIAYLYRHMIGAELRSGRLLQCLDKWLAPLPPFHLYYPSRSLSPVMATFAKALIAHAARGP